jgi:hypothetical protein
MSTTNDRRLALNVHPERLRDCRDGNMILILESEKFDLARIRRKSPGSAVPFGTASTSIMVSGWLRSQPQPGHLRVGMTAKALNLYASLMARP